MTTTNNLPTQFETASLVKRMLIGAAIGLVLMSIFLLGVNEPQPEWGKYWMIRPLVVMLLGGAAGAGCTYFMDLYFSNFIGWKKTLIKVLNVLGFVIALYLSFVLGLAGTMWH
jgi:hypothetical protein